jgi:hypothetical protein
LRRSLYRLLQPSTTSSLLGPHILISAIFSNTLNLRPSLSEGNKSEITSQLAIRPNSQLTIQRAIIQYTLEQRVVK